MRSCQQMILVLVCLAITFSSNAAQSNELGKVFYIRGAGGVTFWSMGDFNDAQDRNKELLDDDGFSTDYEDIGSVFDLAVEAGARVSSMFSVGLTFSRGSKTIENSANVSTLGGDLFVADDYELDIWELVANVAFWVPGASGLYLGASAGTGKGTMTEDIGIRVVNGVNESLAASGDYDGSGFVGGIFAGFQYEFDSAPLVYAEMGFRLRNLGEFDGTFEDPDQLFGEPRDGTPRDFDEEALGDIDYSGFYIRAGLGVAFDI